MTVTLIAAGLLALLLLFLGAYVIAGRVVVLALRHQRELG